LKEREDFNHFVLVGDDKNWKIALSEKTWGFSKKGKGLWEATNEGDKVAFYVTLPIKKIIGFGKITKKYIGNDILFYDEKILGSLIWVYRFNFQIECLIKDWKNGITPPKNLILNVGRKSISVETFQNIKNSILKKV
jgi:hypothetical protein